MAEAFVTMRPDFTGFGAEVSRGLNSTSAGLKQMGDDADEANRKTGGLGSTLSSIGKTAAGVAVGFAAFEGVSRVTQFLGDSVGAAKESARVNAELEAVLKSTGSAAGVTADEARKLASGLQQASLFEDEAILHGENLLFTFTNIGKDIFPRATTAMLDMSQALGQDVQSSAVQLGKALNDPIQGVTALRRVGVQLSDEQERMIKTMVESGDVAGAQNIILAEVEKQMGGTAKAASDAAGSQEQLRDRFNEFQESVGAVIFQGLNFFAGLLINDVIPAVNTLVDAIRPAIDVLGTLFDIFKAALTGDFQQLAAVFQELPVGLQGVGQVVADIAFAIRNALPDLLAFGQGVLDVGGQVATVVGDIARWVVESGLLDQALQGLGVIIDIIAAAFNFLAPIIAAVVNFLKEHEVIAYALVGALAILAASFAGPIVALAALVVAIGLADDAWEQFAALVRSIWESLPGFVQGTLETLAAVVVAVLGGIVGFVTNMFQAMVDVVQLILAVIRGDWDRVWQEMQSIVGNVLGAIGSIIQAQFEAWSAIIGYFLNIILSIVGGVWDAIRGTIETVLNIIGGAVNFYFNAYRELIEAVLNAVWAIVTAAWNTIGATISGALDAIGAAISFAWNTWRDFINDVLTQIWNIVSAAWSTIWQTISSALDTIGNTIANAWNAWRDFINAVLTQIADIVLSGLTTIWQTFERIFTDIYNFVSRIMTDTVNFIWNSIQGGIDAATAFATGIFDAIFGIINNIPGGFRNILNEVIGVMEGGVNQIIHGINTLLGHIPFLGEGISIGALHLDRLAGGGWIGPSGMAVVGERGPELVQLPVGSRVFSNRQSLDMLRAMGIPGFQLGGVVKAAGGKLLDVVKAGAGVVAAPVFEGLRWVMEKGAEAAVNAAFEGLSLPDMPGVFAKLPSKLFDMLKGALVEIVTGAISSMTSLFGGAGPVGEAVERWRSTVLMALAMTGQSPMWADAILNRIRFESGGDPNAINLWDINAQRGDPSGGLMQNIGSAYASRVAAFPELRGTNFLHPLGSIVAGIVYTLQRYGTLAIHANPTLGYAAGTDFVPSSGLAYLHRGEAVIPAGQNRGVTVNLSNATIIARDEDEARRAMADVGWGLALQLRLRGASI